MSSVSNEFAEESMPDDVDRDAFRDFERSAHDRLADTYHAFFSAVTAHAAEPLLAAANVTGRMKVLDVACGSGVIAKHAAELGAVVTGVDLAPRMLDLASRLNPGCTFRQASVDSMPFGDETFDAVVCAFGIGHFPDPPVAVTECARVARQESICAFAWWDVPARNRMHGVLLAALDEVKPAIPPDIPGGAAALSLLERRRVPGIAAVCRAFRRQRCVAQLHVASARCRCIVEGVDGLHGAQFRSHQCPDTADT